MAAAFTLEVDTKNFDRVIEELARYTGKSFQKIILSETASILGDSIKHTRKMDNKRLTARYSYKEGVDNPKLVKYVKVDGRRVQVRRVKRKGVRGATAKGKFRWYPNKLNPMWKKVQDALKEAKARVKKNEYLSKGTWVYIANKLNIGGKLKPKPPGKAQSVLGVFSTALTGVLHGRESGKQNYEVEIKNESRAAMSPATKNGAGGKAAFRNAFNNRVKYFDKNLSIGVFEKTKKITNRYPGMDTIDFKE